MMMMMMMIPMDDGDDDGDDGDDDDDALSQAWFHHIKKWGLFHQVLDLRQLPMSRWHPSGTNQNIVNQLTAQVKKCYQQLVLLYLVQLVWRCQKVMFYILGSI